MPWRWSSSPPLRHSRRPAVSQSGETLIELLVAISLIGITLVGIVGGLGTAIVSARSSHTKVTLQSALLSFAEKIKAAPYLSCTRADGSTYQHEVTGTAGVFTVSPAVTAGDYVASVSRVSYWTGTPTNTYTADPPTNCGPLGADNNLQLLKLLVQDPVAGATTTVQVAKLNPGPP